MCSYYIIYKYVLLQDVSKGMYGQLPRIQSQEKTGY